jgi:hypothetical protein
VRAPASSCAWGWYEATGWLSSVSRHVASAHDRALP